MSQCPSVDAVSLPSGRGAVIADHDSESVRFLVVQVAKMKQHGKFGTEAAIASH
jgi:hypothetical protein